MSTSFGLFQKLNMRGEIFLFLLKKTPKIGQNEMEKKKKTHERESALFRLSQTREFCFSLSTFELQYIGEIF